MQEPVTIMKIVIILCHGLKIILSFSIVMRFSKTHKSLDYKITKMPKIQELIDSGVKRTN